MAVRHIRKSPNAGCWCGVTDAAAPYAPDTKWTSDVGDPKVSKRCAEARTRHVRHVAMHATAGQPISPAVAERLWQPGDDVPKLRARVHDHVKRETVST